jgi:uncharacterized protein (TIRG00374 family)
VGNLRKPLKVGLGLLASVFFLVLAFRGVDPAALMDVLARANLWAVCSAALLEVLALWFRALRWGVLLGNLGNVGARPLFRATLVGYMVNFTLPIRVGEIARAHVLGKEQHLSRMSVFGTIVAERILDAVTILVIAVLWLWFSELPGGDGGSSATILAATYALAGLVLVALAGLWVLVRHTRWLISVITAAVGFFSKPLAGKVRWRLLLLAEGFGPLRAGGDYVRLVIHTVLIWGLSVAAVQVLAAGIGLSLSHEASWLVLVALAVGVSVPSGPGFIGPFHYAAVVALAAYGIDSSTALGYAIVLHAVSTVPIIALGLLALWLNHLSLGGVLSEPSSERR